MQFLLQDQTYVRRNDSHPLIQLAKLCRVYLSEFHYTVTPRMGGNICLRLKKTRRMRTLRNFPLAINERLGLRIIVTEEQCKTLFEGQMQFGE